MLNKVKNIIKEIIFVFHFKKSESEKNNNSPIKALIVFDLSPVISIPIKLKNNIKTTKILKISFSFLKLSKRKPKTIKTNPVTNAPAIGSVLKKLTTLGPCGWKIPSIWTFPYPSMLLPVILST